MVLSRRACVALLLTVLTGGVALAAPPGVTVFVTSHVSGANPPTDEDRGLDEAVRELREALKKKGLRTVDRVEDATVRVEVTNREQGEEPSGGFGGVKVTKFGDIIIRFHATLGETEGDLKGVGQGSLGRAAKDGADKLVKWIARHTPAGTGK